MKKFALPLLAAGLLALGTVAGAAPSFLGPTGLLEVPTASSLAMGNANAFGTFVNSQGDDLTAFGANVGVGFGLEAGLTVLDNNDNDVIINAKWNFHRESLLLPGVAVGALDLTDSNAFGLTPYVVASKTFSLPAQPWKLSGHVGYAAGDVDQAFAAVDAVLTSKITAIAEAFDGAFNFGVRYALTPDVRVDVASLDGDLGLHASYTFGLNK